MSVIVVRPMADGDRAFVLDSWVRSVADGLRLPRSEEARSLRRRALDMVRLRAEAVIDGSHVLVACSAREPGSIEGWLCADRRRLVRLYVRWDQRQSGAVERALYRALEEGETA